MDISKFWRHSDPKVTIKTETLGYICSGSVMKKATTVKSDNMQSVTLIKHDKD